LAAGLRAVDARDVPLDDDFVRAAAGFFAVPRLAVEALPVERLAVDLRAPPLRTAPDADEALLAPALPSIDHLPLITRCAASATASAISEPSLVALAIMLLAALDAVSAASRPASRIARRAFGLALIAAAAAARPAASISLLIAPFASFSTVLSPELEDDPEDLEDFFRADLAMASSPSVSKKTLQARNGSQMKPEEYGSRKRVRDKCKGHRRAMQRCPSTWSAAEGVAVRQRLGPTNTPLRPLC
jgi:hypothetical protein